MRALVDKDGQTRLHAREYSEKEISAKIIHSMPGYIFDKINKENARNWSIRETKEKIRDIAT